MTQEPDAPLSDPVPASLQMEPGRPEKAGDGLVTIAAWVAALALVVILAAAVTLIAFQLKNTRFEIKPLTYEGEERVEVIPPPPPEPMPEAQAITTQDGVVIRPPSWLVAPQPEYPRRAARLRVEGGRVQLECRTSSNGRIENCRVISETPPDAGFAEAAVAAALASRVRPREVDGVAVEGSIRFTTNFRLQ